MENPWNFRDENWFNNARFADDDQIAENCYNCQGAQWTGEGEDLHSDGLPNFQMREYSHSLSAFDKDGSGKAILSLILLPV
jgi:hypothetical protein